MSEFGRTPGPISATRAGREHFIHVHSGLFAGAGVRRGGVIGKSDELGAKIVDPGWSGNRPIYMEDIACTIYSALGIDWTKVYHDDPLNRGFSLVLTNQSEQYAPVHELWA